MPITRPSHASLFTARYPAEHGVRDNISLPLAKDVPTLAETLSAQGFATAAFVSTFVLSSPSGLDRGFDHYDDRFEPPQGDETLLLSTVQRRGDETLTRSSSGSTRGTPESRRSGRRSGSTSTIRTIPTSRPSRSRRGSPIASYDGEVAWTDTLLGRLRASLEARQLWDDALVVVTADHGEALGEHDETGHGFFAYETTLKVPLVMRGPGVPAGPHPRRHGAPGRRRADRPRAARLAGPGRRHSATSVASSWPPAPRRSRHDLRRVADPAGALPVERPAGAARRPVEVHPGAAARAVRPGRRPGRDPRSRRPPTPPPRAGCGPGSRRCSAERERAVSPDTAAATLSAETLQKLGALGYVSPGAAKGSVAQGADPKDKIASSAP